MDGAGAAASVAEVVVDDVDDIGVDGDGDKIPTPGPVY